MRNKHLVTAGSGAHIVTRPAWPFAACVAAPVSIPGCHPRGCRLSPNEGGIAGMFCPLKNILTTQSLLLMRAENAAFRMYRRMRPRIRSQTLLSLDPNRTLPRCSLFLPASQICVSVRRFQLRPQPSPFLAVSPRWSDRWVEVPSIRPRPYVRQWAGIMRVQPCKGAYLPPRI